MKRLVQKKDTKACHTHRAHPTGSAAGSDSLSEAVLSLQKVKPLTGVKYLLQVRDPVLCHPVGDHKLRCNKQCCLELPVYRPPPLGFLDV